MTCHDFNSFKSRTDFVISYCCVIPARAHSPALSPRGRGAKVTSNQLLFLRGLVTELRSHDASWCVCVCVRWFI
jgi:hypothetical protein